jgi:predicted ATPase
MQHITIKNFGPLVDVDIDLPDVMLLIGAQASGKSTLAKLVFYFRSLRKDLIEILNDDSIKNSSRQEFLNQIKIKISTIFLI